MGTTSRSGRLRPPVAVTGVEQALDGGGVFRSVRHPDGLDF